MIACFPVPLHDELLYSACARYQERVAYPSPKAIMMDLFGTKNAQAVIDLPAYLDSLVARMPPGTMLGADEVIDCHTLFPLYAAFLPAKWAAKVRAEMRSGSASGIHMQLGLTASGVSKSAKLRYCPLCVRDDRQTYGEPYWHRSHQVPGVMICSTHSAHLKTWKGGSPARNQFVSADEVGVCDDGLDICGPPSPFLRDVAVDVDFLLNERLKPRGPDWWRARYLQVLAQQGLATYSGKVHIKDVIDVFRNQCPQELLVILGDPDDAWSENWVERLVRSSRSVQNPVRQIAFVRAIGSRLEEIVRGKPRPLFGDGPWPCMNAAAMHSGQLVIDTCTVSFEKSHGRPVGRFRCSCGFEYCVTGPIRGAIGRKDIRVLDYGPMWRCALSYLRYRRHMGLRELARRFSVDQATVKRQLAGIPSSGLFLQRQMSTSREPSTHVRDAKREQWTRASTQDLALGTKQLRQQNPALYAWLYRNDREWLSAHRPAPHGVAAAAKVNWSDRDLALVDSVQSIAEAIRTATGRPVRVTRTMILSRLHRGVMVERHLSMLPHTREVLSQVVEGRKEFAVRRIRWVAECCRKEGTRPAKWQLIRRAGLRSDLVGDCQIEAALLASCLPAPGVNMEKG